MELNIAIVGPLVSIIIEALKSSGFPTKHIKLLNLGVSLLIAIGHSWSNPDIGTIVVNWGVIALATAGTYEIAMRKRNVAAAED